MCGIVGMAGNLSTNHHKMFRDLQLFDTVRGVDSTGVVVVKTTKVNGKNEVLTDKDIGLPDNLWYYSQHKKLFDPKGVVLPSSKVLIGHNRAATIGKITVENAHPFSFDGVHGVHNGSLRIYHELKGYVKHDVDSMCIFDTISQKGIAHTWKKFRGAAALVWWNEDNDHLHMVRNDERPLWTATSEDKKVLFWASEWLMISLAAKRNNVKLFKDKEGFTFHELPVNQHRAYKIGMTDFKLEVDEKLEEMSFPQTNTGPRGYGKNTGVGFKGNSSYVVKTKSKRKGNTTINGGWASKYTKRASSETRGSTITLQHELQSVEGFLGKVLDGHGDMDKGEFITVFSSTPFEHERLLHSIEKGNLKFRCLARPRYNENKSSLPHKDIYRTWGISSASLKPVVTVQATTKKEETKTDNVIGLAKTFQGVRITYDQWRKDMKQGLGKCSCTWCNNPLIPENSHSYRYLSRFEALCEDCAKDDVVIKQVGVYYPQFNFDLH